MTDTKTNVRNVDGVGLWSPSKNSSDEWRAEKLQLEEPIVSPPEEFSDKPNNSKPEEFTLKSSSLSPNSTPLPTRRNKRVSRARSREETACLAAFHLLTSRFPHVARLATLFPGADTTRVHLLQGILDLRTEEIKEDKTDDNILLLPPSENAHTFAELQGALLKRIQKMQEVSRE